MGLQCRELRRFINAVIRHVVENSVLHKDADRSTYEGGEEVNVDVVTGAVETPEEERDKKTKDMRFREFLLCLPHICIFNEKKKKTTFRVLTFSSPVLLEIAEDGDRHQQ